MPHVSHLVLLALLAITGSSHGAVYTIQAVQSHLYLCAESISLHAQVLLLSDKLSKDITGNPLCYWTFDTIGHIYLAGGNGTLTIDAGHTADCGNETVLLSHRRSNHAAQYFGWVKSPHGDTLQTDGGYGTCALDTIDQTQGGAVKSGVAGSSVSQSFIIDYLACPSGQYWDQDSTSPTCIPCPVGSTTSPMYTDSI
jgi:hypothetical protein